ncbi:MAG: DNA-binding transcriptional regulator [Dysgonamonadaceae bacterium]|jgi:LacI family transcriptional regulator|nr:DNA-binding transcriptional regulator [Dysgonamonadaceae bacterium]
MKKILLLTDFSSGYSRSLLRGIVRYSNEQGPWMFYRMPQYYRELYGDDGVVRWAKNWKADAIIAQLENVDLDKLNELGIPIIIQNYKERANKICNITGDYFGTGEMAAGFFLNRGFSNFAYYGFKDMVWSRERADGFRSKVEKHGYTVSMLNNDSHGTEQWSFDLNVLRDWLMSLPKPVALFTCDDYFALQITETCKIYNIAVPEDIAVLGVDNDELLCNISYPPLSSIVLDVETGGYMAAERLHQLMNHEITETFDIVIPPTRIESRQSTEKYAVDDKYILKVIEYIKANYARDISIKDIVRSVPLSRRVLEKRFKGKIGISLYQYLLQYRIELFSDLLIKTDKPLADLALMCGFDDYKNVVRVFRKYKKITPLQYRNQYREVVTNLQK